MKVCKPVFIYRYTNLINGKVYIGSTVNIKKRQRQHKEASESTIPRMERIYFYQATRKYGWNNFKFEIIEENVCIIIRNERENYWIKHHNSLDRKFGYNSCLADKREPSDEVRAKMSATKKGKKKSDETRAKMSASHQGKKHPGYGKKLSEETKARMSAAKKGKKKSDETKAKMSLAQKGKVVSDETRAKMSDAKKGTTLSDERKANISQKLTGIKRSDETRANISKSKKGEKHPMYGKKLSDEHRANMSIAQKAYNARIRAEKRKRNLDRLLG